MVLVGLRQWLTESKERDKDSACHVTASETKEPFHFMVYGPARLAFLISANHEPLDQL